MRGDHHRLDIRLKGSMKKTTVYIQLFFTGMITLLVMPLCVLGQTNKHATMNSKETALSAAISLPRLSGPIKIDGRIDEEAWAAIEPVPLVTYQPTYRGAKSQRSEIRVAYDDNYIYAAGRFYVEDPGDLRGNSFYRDRWSGDDTFGLLLDTFNDNETAPLVLYHAPRDAC